MALNGTTRITRTTPLPSLSFRRIAVFFHSGGIPPSPRRSLTARPTVDGDEDGGKSIKVTVWWDFENCTVSGRANIPRVVLNIMDALRQSGIGGPVTINAFGDVLQLSRANQEALAATGVCVNHVPRCGKNSADRSLLVDLVYWASCNPPPAHLFLISGDGDFSNILHRLRMNNYNILLAGKERMSPMLCSAASIVWQWNGLVSGHNLIGTHYNHPPDGISKSWYGYPIERIEDPFADVERSEANDMHREDEVEPNMETSPRPVPKPTIDRIRQLLFSNPQGISDRELYHELTRYNLYLDKDFFGHKKFSQMLLSLPNILRIQLVGEGEYMIYGTRSKAVEPSKADSKSLTQSSKDKDCEVVSNASKIVPTASREPKTKNQLLHSHSVHAETRETTEISDQHVVTESATSHSAAPHVESFVTTGVTGPFSRFWKAFFGRKDEPTVDASNISDGALHNDPSKSLASSAHSSSSDVKSVTEKTSDGASTEKDVRTTSVISCDPLNESTCNTRLSTSEDKSDGKAELPDIEVSSPRFMSRMLSGLMFWRTSPGDSEVRKEQSSDGSGRTMRHDLFHKGDLWDELKAFLLSSEGRLLLSKAKTRQDLTTALRKEGPSIVTDLEEEATSTLVEILIEERKWIAICASETFPFRLQLPHGRPCTSPSRITSNPNFSKKLCSVKRDKRVGRNQPRDVPGSDGNIKQFLQVVREGVVKDCQKLLDDVLKDKPEGLHLNIFRKMFENRYRYVLDHEGLGYRKLSLFVRTMRGVRLGGDMVFSAKETLVDDNKREDDSGKHGIVSKSLEREGDESGACSSTDSVVGGKCIYDELGPITSGSDIPVVETEKHTESVKRANMQTDFNEGSCFSDTKKSAGSVSQHVDSLLHILESCSNKTESVMKKDPQNLDSLADCQRIGNQVPCSEGREGPGLEANGVGDLSSTMKPKQKLKLNRSFSFVLDPVKDVEGSVVDRILGRIENAGPKVA